MEEKKMEISMISAINLLDRCIKAGFIQQDPSDKNRILVYRKEGELYPEGWYSDNIFTVASELCRDAEGIRYLEGHWKRG